MAFSGIAMTPWIFKALYGLLSDRVPLCGYKRAPYIVIAGVRGGIANAGLAGVNSPWAFSAFAFLSALGTAVPDVMVDAVVAERSRANPSLAADLQVLCWCLTLIFTFTLTLTLNLALTLNPHPHLQVLCWSSFGLMNLICSAIKGPVFEAYGGRVLYMTLAVRK